MKKFTILILFLIGIGQQIYAQQNIAPLATVTASTCNTGSCATLNDLQLGTCGTQIMWITTATPPDITPGVNWIQFDWTSVRTVNRFIIHHAQTNTRFLAGGTIQTWNGSAWITVSTFSNLTPACSSVVNFPTTNTQRLRITSFTMSGTQLSNPNFREIEVYGPSVNNDASVTGFSALSTCTYTQKIDATVSNLGKRRLDSFRLYWSVNNVTQGVQYLTSSLTTGQSATYTLSSAYTFAPNTVYTIRAWTDRPNGTVDSVSSNDLLTTTLDFMGAATAPTVTDFVQCGRAIPRLVATTSNPADSVFWYDNATGGNLIGFGKSINGPFTPSTRTFYAEAAKLSRNFQLTTIQTTGVNVRQTEPYGGMQTIVTNKQILLDSIQFRLWYATPTNCGYQLYYRTGAHTSFITNPNGWIKLNEGVITYVTQGGINYGRVSAKNLNLPAGTYAFYLTTDLDFGAGNSLYSTLNGPGASNADMAIQTGGHIIIGKFGSTQTLTYQPQLMYIYKNQCVSPSRTPLTVTVKPTPIGASVSAGTPFQGQFKFGNISSPDVIEVGKTLTYELTPPSGFANADHGSTWFVSNVSAKTRFNVTVPSSEFTVTNPSGGNAGTLSFTPKSAWLDSFITFSIKVADLGPHFCDSTVSRTIYVAPTPKPNFRFPSSICLGDQTLFENISTISSGVCSYRWDFGDGDTSTFNSPVHEFKNPGTYFVKLTATSFTWNVSKDTIIQVNIGEVPLVDFRVKNACQGSAIELTNVTIIGNGTLSYVWNFGDNSPTRTTTNATKTYTVPGPYLVTLTAEAGGCVASKSKVVYQFAKPVANFDKVQGECLNDKFLFTNSSTIALGQFGNKWDFDDQGNIASDLNTDYMFTSAGTKRVKLIAISEFGCMDSITKNIVVKQIPIVDFDYPFACDRSATPFNNLTNTQGESILRYDWNFGNGLASTQINPSVKWPNTGSRNVSLKATLTNGCSAEMVKNIHVGVQPKADFEFADQCSDQPVSFTNLSTYSNGNIKYDWNFGDKNTSTLASPIHTYNSTTVTATYFVQLKASIEGGCQDSIIKSVTINPLPSTCNFDIQRNWSVNPRNYTFTPTGGSLSGINYTWVLGDGNRKTSSGAGTDYTYKGNIKYCITMIAKNASDCECYVTKCITVNTSVEDNILATSFNVYPNPNTGIFTISSDNSNETFKVEIYNSIGVLVTEKTVLESENFDLTNVATGIYTARIITAKGILTQMITINN